MADLHSTTSCAIDASRHAIAQAAVGLQYERRPELRALYGELGRAKCVQDVDYHLAYLATAVAAASPTLFTNYVAWAKVVLVSRKVRPEDVAESLTCVGEVLRQQFPGEAGALAREYVEAALRELPEAPADVPSFLEGGDPMSQLARQYLDALLRGDRHAAGRLVLDAVGAGTAVRDVYLRVLQRSQQELGRLWQLNRLSVAQEHFCTAATQFILSQLYPRVFTSARTGRSLVAACVGGELHDVGVHMVSDFFEMEGWDTYYLGANAPARDIVEAVGRRRPDVLAVSATMVYHLPAAARLIAAVRASEACAGTKVLVGGSPFGLDPELWRQVGADAFARDAQEAVAAANRLLAGDPTNDGGGRGHAGLGRLARLTPPSFPLGEGGVSLYDELSRLNNELSAAQRELAKKNAELTETDHRKDEFLAVLAHELRNPLAPIRQAAQILEARGKDDPDVRYAHEVVNRQVQQLTRLVDDLMDVTRVARGKVQLRKEVTDAAAVVSRAVETSLPLVEERRHQLTATLPQEPLLVEADPARLQQVLLNLLNNAAKYTEPGGRIELAVTREGEEAVLRVRDNGIGITPEMLPRVFGLFAQVEEARERAQGGLGIGLALVKSLVEMHGGTVKALSAGPGRGSEFVVRLPALPERRGTAPQKAGREGGQAVPPPGGLRVLVIDDNVDAADSLAMLLGLKGHTVQVTYDGESALRTAQAGLPEVVLMDIGLPKMDGYEVARRLRASPAGRGVLLVALTGWGQEEDRRRSREAGFDHHMTKPVDLDALQQLLASTRRQPGSVQQR